MGVLRQNGFSSPASVPTLRAHAPPARCCSLMAAPPAESQTHAAEYTRRRSRVPSEGCVARHAAKKPAGVRALACCILSFFARCFAGRVLRVSGAGTARIPVPDVVGTDGAHTRFVGTNRPRALGKRMEEKKSWSGEVTLLVVAFGGGKGSSAAAARRPSILSQARRTVPRAPRSWRWGCWKRHGPAPNGAPGKVLARCGAALQRWDGFTTGEEARRGFFFGPHPSRRRVPARRGAGAGWGWTCSDDGGLSRDQ